MDSKNSNYSYLKIDKQLFETLIKAIKDQHDKDSIYRKKLSDLSKCDDVEFYDNSSLINSIFTLLQKAFTQKEKGFCLIEHFCWELNFGSVADSNMKTISDLWESLKSTD